MTSKNSIVIETPAADVWQLIGPEFVPVDRWMAAIPFAEAIPGPALPGAPARGRNSYLIKKFAPMYQEEIITEYDPEKMTLGIDVTLRNTARFMPLKGYTSTVIVEAIDATSCKLTWIGKATAKWFAKPMTGVLTKSMDAGFIRNLEEIKHIVETGQPHPRKLAKIESEAALAA